MRMNGRAHELNGCQSHLGPDADKTFLRRPPNGQSVSLHRALSAGHELSTYERDVTVMAAQFVSFVVSIHHPTTWQYGIAYS